MTQDQQEGPVEAATQALWKVVAYDQLLRRVGEFGEYLLLAGEMPKVDAVYDDMVATAIATLPKLSTPISTEGELLNEALTALRARVEALRHGNLEDEGKADELIRDVLAKSQKDAQP